MREKTTVPGREGGGSGSPRRLQQAPGREVDVPKVSPRLAQEEPSDRQERGTGTRQSRSDLRRVPVSPVRISVARARARAFLETAVDCGLSLPGSYPNSSPSGSSSKMLPRAQSSGSTPLLQAWDSWAIARFRSHSRRRIQALRICVDESLLLPTPTASRYGSSQNGCPGDGRTQYKGKGKPSLWTMAARGTLPGHPVGPLDPRYMEWMLGFPDLWTDVPPSVTRSFRSAPK